MDIEGNVYQWLEGHLAGRLYPSVIPKGVNDYPCAAYERVGDLVPEEDGAPYGAEGVHLRLTVLHTEDEDLRAAIAVLRAELAVAHPGYWVDELESEDLFEHEVQLFAWSLEFTVIKLALI